MIKSLRFLAVATVAAFALAACDETPTAVTGTISGSVTIEGDGATGVTVSLSSGASTTTDASGAFSFANVDAGSYVVTISGFAADASFAATSQTAVIASAGQVASANFSGSYVRTSGIVGNVSVATVGPIAGVAVALSGAGTAATTTDAAGQYAFTGLRAGTYTVTISGYDATYTFATPAQSATVGAGATEVVSFSGSLTANASISGALYFDENDKNDTYDGPTLEELVAAANVLITLNGPSIGQTQTTQTDSTGAYTFTDLVAGTYAVVIADTDADIPASVTFGGTSNTTNVTVTAGGSASVYFPFDITQQTVAVCQFTGTDGVSPGHNPVAGASIDLYFLEANVGTGSTIPTQVTDTTGCTSFVFDRSVDISPSPGVTDNIVYAELVGTPLGYTDNGETSFEIGYNPKTASSLASDTFDVQSTLVWVGFDAVTVTGIDSLGAWAWDIFDDSASATAVSLANELTDAPTNALGAAYGQLSFLGTIDTVWARVDSASIAQPVNGNAFGITPIPSDSTAQVASEYLSYINNGYNLQNDTVWIGTDEIKFLTANINAIVYHEADDSLVTPMMTAGDDFAGVTNVDLFLSLLSTADSSVTTADFVTETAAVGTGVVTFGGIAVFTDSLYSIRAVSTDTVNAQVLMDTIYVGLQEWSGASFTADQCQLMGTGANCATFAMKFRNQTASGTVLAADGSDADGIAVRIQADSMNIEGSPVDTTVYSTGGAFTLAGMVEGPFTITVADSITAGGDTIWAFGADSLRTCSVDMENGAMVPGACAFTAMRMDTKVLGVVVNDRDGDGNTIDPNEALPGATMNLFRGVGTSTDSLMATTTTSANGSYGFTKLPEGTYTVQVDGSTAGLTGTALQALTAAGVAIDTQVVHTAATAAGLGSQLTRQVGDTVAGSTGLPTLPAWDYAASVEGALGAGGPTHFTYLADDTQITGSIVDGSAAAAVGVTVTLQRCVTSPVAATSPPVSNGTCTTMFPGTPLNFVTGADGLFSFSNLQGGRYQVTVNPVTGGFTSSSPSTLLYETKEPGDIEAAAAAIVVN